MPGCLTGGMASRVVRGPVSSGFTAQARSFIAADGSFTVAGAQWDAQRRKAIEERARTERAQQWRATPKRLLWVPAALAPVALIYNTGDWTGAELGMWALVALALAAFGLNARMRKVERRRVEAITQQDTLVSWSREWLSLSEQERRTIAAKHAATATVKGVFKVAGTIAGLPGVS